MKTFISKYHFSNHCTKLNPTKCQGFNKLQKFLDYDRNPSINPILQHEKFTKRHIGPNKIESAEILKKLKLSSIEELINQTVPKQILLSEEQKKKQDEILGEPLSENAVLHYLKQVSSLNKIFKNYIGLGYNPVIVPNVVLRNVLENPAWYTSYTPYQAEISQGRLESLINFQTLISELTGLPFSNASLLDEATAAGEAMYMAHSIANGKKKDFFVADNVFPFIRDTINTRAHFLGINVIVGNPDTQDFTGKNFFGGIVQNPGNNGKVKDYTDFAKKLKDNDAVAIINADIMSLVLCRSAGDMGFDIAVGSAQRFGVPMMNGGPHAGFMATRDEFKRKMPGRIIGKSKDVHNNTGYRLSIQTREQHIRRDKATSNICTAQALLANMSAFYSLFHGKSGLTKIAMRLNHFANIIQSELVGLGYAVEHKNDEIFDTVTINAEKSKLNGIDIINHFENNKINLRQVNNNLISISTNEQMTLSDVEELLVLFAELKNDKTFKFDVNKYSGKDNTYIKPDYLRNPQNFLNQDIFNKFSSETQLLRYIYSLQLKDISLCNSMISLGSCTMKMNATAELIPVTWPEFSEIHPFAPPDQSNGYSIMIRELEEMLCSITQFDGCSLQPNSGANGEFAGLLAIRRFYDSIGQSNRNICLIPSSAHGTNPASASVIGMKIVVTQCDKNGNIDINDLKAKAELHSKNLAALMVTYPSTHGVYEEGIKEITDIIHKNGGQVYMDGANMNAQVAITAPGVIGADVCHLNLHKTFCIPHGGGGPGVGPICVKKHLIPFLPGHEQINPGKSNYSTSSAPYGSAGILPISYVYIKLMGKDLLKATQHAILNANYIMERLKDDFKILFRGNHGRVAHEFIIDLREIKEKIGITETDLAKRLMDYGFHAPTMSFPVPGTLMIEPTESEDKGELDRFCEAMLKIRQEIREVESGEADKLDNVLKNAPHTETHICSDSWNHKYSREKAAFPLPYIKKRGKVWPSVGRIDNEFGDRNLICTCGDTMDYDI